ncbi:MAG: response regulator [Ferruginibacter sp.]
MLSLTRAKINMEESRKKILYAEDDPDDREFFVDAISAIDPALEVVLAENGVKALEYLQKLNNANEPLPCLIILDINMPYMNGKETLAKIKAENWLEHISTYILTSGANPNDKAYFNKFSTEMITKPADPIKLRSVVSEMLKSCE